MTFKLYCFLQWCLQPITDLRLTILIPLLSHQLTSHPARNLLFALPIDSSILLQIYSLSLCLCSRPNHLSLDFTALSPQHLTCVTPTPETKSEMNQWFLPTSQWSPLYLDKNGVQSHFWGLFRHQATEQLQSHVHFPTHTAAHVGYQGTHHFLRWQKAEENFNSWSHVSIQDQWSILRY